MSNTKSKQPFVPYFLGFALLSSLFLFVAVPALLPATDDPKSGQKEEQEDAPRTTKKGGRKPPREEEEEPQKKTGKATNKKPPKEEEEDSGKGKRKSPLRVGDEDDDNQPAAKGEPGQTSDLEREAKQSKNPLVRELFQALAIPHDIVTMRRSNQVFIVEPIAKYVGNDPQFTGRITLQVFNDEWKVNRTHTHLSRELSSVDHYESVALRKVNDFLASGLEREPKDSKKYLSRLEMLQAAEKVLAAVIRFHESARLRGVREGDEWDDLLNSLRAKLQNIQIDQLRIHTDAKDWSAAFDLGTRLAEKYRKETAVQVEVARLLAAHAEHAIQSQDFTEARRRLVALESDFPKSKEIDQVRDALRRRAQSLVDQAEKMEKDGKTIDAIAVLKIAENVFPLPGLHDRYLRLNRKYPIIYVGVHDLPENMLPGLAYTDSERQAVELQFESLIKLSYDPALGQRYDAELAGELPRLLPLGRRFELLRNAYWSDGKLVTAADVRNTVRLLCDPKWPGYVPEWAEFMADAAHVRGGDAFHIDLIMRQGYMDPLSFMDFKVLPESLAQVKDAAEFATAPVGSGPFRYSKDKSRAGEEVVFEANPYYANRQGKIGLPRIREIHFIVSKDRQKDFTKGREQGQMCLLLDLPTARIKEVSTIPEVSVLPKMRNRRIYFLAVNNRSTVLRSQPLRRAIAHGINREQILTDVFRDGNADFHRPLNGPYPRYSWACKQDLPADPFSLDKAKAFLQSAKTERPIIGKIALKFPEDDEAVAQACGLIQKQLKEIGLEIELAPRPRRQLRREVEEENNYDLAYYSWDFANEAYWIWPLLDPAAAVPGGRNFLGYLNDDILSSLFRKTMTHREFAVIKQLTHEIHDRLYEQMPFIPLWQLDTHVAVHSTLNIPITIDPLLVFTDVETWTLEKK